MGYGRRRHTASDTLRKLNSSRQVRAVGINLRLIVRGNQRRCILVHEVKCVALGSMEEEEFGLNYYLANFM